MTGWNMPPGVNVSDIPGNRPEDEAEEVFWDELEKKLTLIKVAQDNESVIPVIDAIGDNWDEDWFVQAISKARDMGFDAGYNQGCADESMQISGFEMEVGERLESWLQDHPRASARQAQKREAQIRREMATDDD